MKKTIFTKHNKNSVKAFTLLETLTSIAIISAVVLGPLTVAVNSSSYARQTKDVMSSVYLAEETIELLRHQQDSYYIACLKSQDPCGAGIPLPDETVGETSWRIFKDALGGTNSCFSPDSCSYDFQDLIFSTTTDMTKYSTSTAECSTLVVASAPMVVDGDLLDTLRKYYVCNGVPSHMTGASQYLAPGYTRRVTVESLPSFETASSTYYYHDDLRVSTTVTYRASNGRIRQIKVVDFLHARS